MKKKKKVTIDDLALKLNLSRFTVSKALRGLPGMSEETRFEVLKLARELGYRTKEQERSLAVEHIPFFAAKPRRFLLLFSEMYNYSTNQCVLQGLHERLTELGHKMETLVLPNSIMQPYEFKDWEQSMIDYCDGIFITNGMPEELEKRLIQLKLPRILLNYPPSLAEIDSIVWDTAYSVYQSVHHLVAKGHRYISYIGDTESSRGGRIRWQAFKEALMEQGITCNLEQNLIPIKSQKNEWISIFLDHIQQTQSTAFICLNDYLIPWIFLTCSLINKKIPDDFSLISLDASPQSEFVDCTRAKFVVQEVAHRAVDRILWRIANPNLHFEHVRIRGSFYEGKTVNDKI